MATNSKTEICNVTPDTGDPCKPLTQEAFYHIIMGHVVANDLRIGVGSGNTEITIELSDLLVGDGLQKIDFKKLEQKIAEGGNMYFDGETYVPIKELAPGKLIDYILADGDKPLFYITGLEVPKTIVNDRDPVKFYAINDISDCCDGKLIYEQYRGNNNRVRLSGENPSDLLKQVKKDITER
jgi:hypothetical protein